MSQKGTVGLLLLGGGAVVAYLTWQDLINQSNQASQVAAQNAAGQSPFITVNLPGITTSPFGTVPKTTAPTGATGGKAQTSFGSVPATSQPGGKNTQPGTISRVGTQCPPGQTFIPIAGGTTGTCVRNDFATRGTNCPPGQVFVPVGGGTTGTCVPQGNGQTPRPCLFGFIFC